MSDDNDLQKTNHRIDMLQCKMEANMETLKASMEALQAKNEASNERLRTDMEKGLSANANKIMIAMGIGFAFLSGVIGFLALFLNGNS